MGSRNFGLKMGVRLTGRSTYTWVYTVEQVQDIFKNMLFVKYVIRKLFQFCFFFFLLQKTLSKPITLWLPMKLSLKRTRRSDKNQTCGAEKLKYGRVNINNECNHGGSWFYMIHCYLDWLGSIVKLFVLCFSRRNLWAGLFC